MNDPQQPCEHRREVISLLAADCLTRQEECDLREHLAVCDACRRRFEEITTVCSNVRTAKPALKPESLLAMERSLQHLPRRGNQAAENRRPVARRAALLAAAVLVLAGVLRPFVSQQPDHGPTPPTDIVAMPSHGAPAETSDLRLPTMLALRRAAAESDDSFDLLLARYSDPSLLEPLNHHTFSRESWP